MTTWIVGAGAIGSVIGAKLAHGGDVIFVDSWQDHVKSIRESGLTVEFPEGSVHVNAPAFHLSELSRIGAQPEVVVLAVKSNFTVETVNLILPYLSDHSMVVSAQNCINEDTIAGLVGADRTIGAMVRFGGALLGPGHVKSTQRVRRLVIGELDGSLSDRLRSLAAMLQPSVNTELTDNIWGHLWTKMVRNAELNAVAALTGFRTDEIANDSTTRRVALTLGMETVRVALALGMVLDPAELFGPPESYLEALGSPAMNEIERRFVEQSSQGPGVKASMLQDVERGRPTEIDYMNGYVVQKGRGLGVPTPLNAQIVQLVKEVETHQRQSSPSVVPEVFAELIAEVA